MNRRDFLSRSALTAVSMASAAPMLSAGEHETGSFDFIFFTDTHIQPELNAAAGCAQCFRKIRSIPVDFAIQGGDLVFDAMGVGRQRAISLYDLYDKTEQDLGLKVYHTFGNHDAFGVDRESGVQSSEPGFGKELFRNRLGETYYSFDHKGYHFVVLDSIQIAGDRNWSAGIDEAQLVWLGQDLSRVLQDTPIVVTVHVPLLSGAILQLFPGASSFDQLVVTNSREVLSLFEGHRVLAVLQGHFHINDADTFKGIHYLTCGAVCGKWWQGANDGCPEGFTVVSLKRGSISWRYETYGFTQMP
jgi:3',5'-cyclic-AMP phosphodiesterase